MMRVQLNRYPVGPVGGLTAGVAIDEIMAYAVRLIGSAGQLAVDRFHTGAMSRPKADGSEVTDADLAVEELIRTDLARHAPDDGVYGEEGGESAGRSGRRWVIDPISGTGYFTRRMPLFANLLAYEDEHGPAVGLINLPMQREMLVAGRGQGCFLVHGADSRTRVWVDRASELRDALTLAGNQQTWPTPVVTALHRSVALVGGIHHPAFYVATGRVRAAVLNRQGYEDLAPLPVIVAEAGGRITGWDGGPVLGGAGSAVLANPDVHARLLEIMAAPA
jgi:histidinol-phosphatase